MQLGRKEEALSNYLMALHTYELASGKKSTSYVSTLANLGDVWLPDIVTWQWYVPDRCRIMQAIQEANLQRVFNFHSSIISSSHHTSLPNMLHVTVLSINPLIIEAPCSVLPYPSGSLLSNPAIITPSAALTSMKSTQRTVPSFQMQLILPWYSFTPSLLLLVYFSPCTILFSSRPALLGVLYRLIAETSTGAERDDHLEKAGEALKDALELRIEMTGAYLGRKRAP